MASNSNYNDVTFFFPSFILSFCHYFTAMESRNPSLVLFLLMPSSPSVETPLQKDPLEVSVLLHVFLDHLVDVVRRLAGHQVL